MFEFIKVCVVVGILILLLTPLLLVVDVLVVALCTSRKPLKVLAAVTCIPLLLGLLGTAAGYTRVHRSSEGMELSDTDLVRQGRAQARYTTHLGAGSTGLLMLVLIMGTACRTGEADPARRPVG